ncbi:hypothetical protein BKA81DRAFT_374963 [Phyllosticta paracitricarpa]
MFGGGDLFFMNRRVMEPGLETSRVGSALPFEVGSWMRLCTAHACSISFRGSKQPFASPSKIQHAAADTAHPSRIDTAPSNPINQPSTPIPPHVYTSTLSHPSTPMSSIPSHLISSHNTLDPSTLEPYASNRPIPTLPYHPSLSVRKIRCTLHVVGPLNQRPA